MPRREVAKPNVARQTAEQRNSLSNEHGHARDNEPLNGPLAQKPLNRDSPVDVQVLDPAGSELRDDLRWRPGHLFHNRSEEHTPELQSQSNLVCRLLLAQTTPL